MEKIFKLKVSPRSSENKISETLADGTIKISLTASPVDGKANIALIQFLSLLWKIPKINIRITKGLKSRHKTIAVDLPRLNSTDCSGVLSK